VIGIAIASFIGLLILINWASSPSRPESVDRSTDAPTIAQSPAPTFSKATPVQIVPAPLIPLPSEESDLLSVLSVFRSRYEDAPNEFQKSTIRKERARELARIVPDHSAVDWIGTVSRLQTTSEGDGVLILKAYGNTWITIGTWNNSLSDLRSGTLIPASSPLYEQAANLFVGQIVKFSGRFGSSGLDFLQESSLTEAGSMNEPEFIFTFTSVEPFASTN
jgi:hypothetical protein